MIITEPYGDFRYVAEMPRGARLLVWSAIRVGASADDLRTISHRQVPRAARKFVYSTRYRYRQMP
jgi:hypothetical protein